MIVIVLTTVPDRVRGEAIARALVDGRLAACVNILPAMTSIYRWKGSVETETEHQLVIKTESDRLAAVEARIAELHPYEVPELLVVPIAHGSAGYAAWVNAETRAE